MTDLQFKLEMLLADRCMAEEIEAEKAGKAHKCNCPLPERMTDEEIKKLIKELKND